VAPPHSDHETSSRSALDIIFSKTNRGTLPLLSSGQEVLSGFRTKLTQAALGLYIVFCEYMPFRGTLDPIFYFLHRKEA